MGLFVDILRVLISAPAPQAQAHDYDQPDFDKVDIQYLDVAGGWQTVATVDNDSTQITYGMEQAGNTFAGHRVRAVKQGTKQVVDILT
jgi:hypothetical protein